MEKRSYRLDEIAQDWDVSRKTVERLVRSGELEAFKIGSVWRVKSEQREEFEKKNRLIRTLSPSLDI